MRRQQLRPLSPSFCHSSLSSSGLHSLVTSSSSPLALPRFSVLDCCFFCFLLSLLAHQTVAAQTVEPHAHLPIPNTLTTRSPFTLPLPSPSPRLTAAAVQVAMELSSSLSSSVPPACPGVSAGIGSHCSDAEAYFVANPSETMLAEEDREWKEWQKWVWQIEVQ